MRDAEQVRSKGPVVSRSLAIDRNATKTRVTTLQRLWIICNFRALQVALNYVLAERVYSGEQDSRYVVLKGNV